ncbi:hypothetical protein AKJ09_07389 [Labilithrix luteola]|uniref:YchJ-like middle NTF2-like domain-containing protein n=2 Tax=Labilithrix luteola TaxID=1391654 RepID=A0A0K1Q4J2_9BACT|nr:hypothetical protein AKJ09_07389 [Labilithrix luteola]
MRSRYAAFALGLGDYLVDTLASTHPDHESPRQELARALSRARERQRFLGLRILHTEEDEGGERGEVLFYARIFERGHDVSFAELSTFVREDGAWRYAEGVLVPGEKLPRDGEGLTRERFLALAR